MEMSPNEIPCETNAEKSIQPHDAAKSNEMN